MATAMKRLRSVGAALTVMSRQQDKPLSSSQAARFLGAGSPCLDALIWRPEKMTAAMQAKCFSVVCKAALKNLKDYKDQPTCTF